jgi:hypothetical protein
MTIGPFPTPECKDLIRRRTPLLRSSAVKLFFNGLVPARDSLIIFRALFSLLFRPHLPIIGLQVEH